MRRFGIALLALSLTLVPAAVADTFDITFNTSMGFSNHFMSNVLYEGMYTTGPDAWGTQPTVSVGLATRASRVHDLWVTVTPWDTITSAHLYLRFPSETVTGGTNLFFLPIKTLGGTDPNQDPVYPYVEDGSITGTIKSVALGGKGPVIKTSKGYDLSSCLILMGSAFSCDLASRLDIWADLIFTGDVLSPGYNWNGTIGAEGDMAFPYTLEIEGTFDENAAPEPGTMALLGTALVGLIAEVRRRSRETALTQDGSDPDRMLTRG